MHWCRIKIDQCELTFINTNKMGKDFVSSRTCCFDMKYSKCQCGGIGTARERCWDLNIKYTLGLECRNLHGYNIELIQQWKDGYFFINFSENLTKIIRTSMTQCKKQKYLLTYYLWCHSLRSWFTATEIPNRLYILSRNKY